MERQKSAAETFFSAPPLLKSGLKRQTIESIELFERRVDDAAHHFLVIRSKEDVEGVCVTSPRILDIFSLFSRRVVGFFLGKDAREIESMLVDVYRYRTNYKFDSMPFWNSVANIETAILDLLGKAEGLSCAELLGRRLRDALPVYLSSMRRDNTADEEVDYLEQRLAETGARACKMKIGGRMNNDEDAAPGRTENLVRLAGERLGEFKLLYDSNSSYSVQGAIEIGRMLEDNGASLFEEPVRWLDFEGTLAVKKALNIDIGAGEQEYDPYKLGWLIDNEAVSVLQQDVHYFGGIIRGLQMSKIANAHGIPVAPHSPHTGPLTLGMLHIVSMVERPYPFVEWHVEPPRPAPWCSQELAVQNGALHVPDGPGLGVTYDMEWIRGGERIAHFA